MGKTNKTKNVANGASWRVEIYEDLFSGSDKGRTFSHSLLNSIIHLNVFWRWGSWSWCILHWDNLDDSGPDQNDDNGH
jgi:hypothetical protein